MKILKGLLSLLLCLCLITPMGSAIVALNDGGIANMGSQANSGSPTSAPSETPAPSDTDTPVEAPDYAALYMESTSTILSFRSSPPPSSRSRLRQLEKYGR